VKEDRSILPSLNRIKVKISKLDRIVTVSCHAKEDIIKFFKVPEEKIEVIYNCCDRKIFNENEKPHEKEYLQAKYKIKTPYFLHVSSGAPKKNVPFILDAFSKLPKDITLVLAGLPPERYVFLKRLCIYKGLSNVKLLPNILSDEDLAMLYRQSLAFILPSKHESCPFVLIEALSCGKLCIVSEKTSLPEIAENAAIYIDINKPGELSKVLRDIIKGKYNLFNRRGINLVKKKYNPETFAKKHLNIYKELLE